MQRVGREILFLLVDFLAAVHSMFVFSQDYHKRLLLSLQINFVFHNTDFLCECEESVSDNWRAHEHEHMHSERSKK